MFELRVRLTFRIKNEKIKLEYSVKDFIIFKLLIPALAILIYLDFSHEKY